MKIYAMSDIHGYADILRKNLEQIDLTGENRLILLGDYIDYGPQSKQTLDLVIGLQREYGPDKVIALKGNHEVMFLEWIEDYRKEKTFRTNELIRDSWLKTDAGQDYKVLSGFLSGERMARLRAIERTATFYEINHEAVRLVLEADREIIRWMGSLESFYETETQIFVHAGVDEEAGEDWKWGTSEEMFLWKYPASTGRFYKTIIAGHIGTAGLANDPDHHGIYYDGRSHFFIDGSVVQSGRIPILLYDSATGQYCEIMPSGEVRQIIPH